MWTLVDSSDGKTFVMPVEGGWLVRHQPLYPFSKTVTYVPDADHVTFDVQVVPGVQLPNPGDVAPPPPVVDPVTPQLPTDPVQPTSDTYLDPIYNQSWEPGWTHNSWAVVDAAYVDGGETVIRADVDGWSALNISYRNGRTFSTLDTKGISFDIKGEGDGFQVSDMRVCFVDGTSVIGCVPLADIMSGLPTNDYMTVTVDLADAGIKKAYMTNIWIQGTATGDRAAVLIKNVNLVRWSTEILVPDVNLPNDHDPVVPTPFDLTVVGNKIHDLGVPWQGRGVNLHDTRGNNACAYSQPDVAEVSRRLEHLSQKGVNFVRLLLESYPAADGRTHFASILDDKQYLNDVIAMVNIAGTLGMKVMLTPWVDPSYPGSQGIPTPYLKQVWRVLAHVFRDAGHVIFGILNEPTGNYDGSQNASRRQGYEDILSAIRRIEGNKQHICTVQGIGGWARHMDYWASNPLADTMVAYEVHVYDPEVEFDKRFIVPSQKIPVIIGEFGPDGTYMGEADCSALIQKADAAGVSWLAWAFHPESHPSMLVNGGNNCGIGMDLNQMTSWGQIVMGAISPVG